jgi:release factor glutamine methyltransferase
MSFAVSAVDNVRSMLMTPRRERLLDELAKSFADRGIEALMLRGPNLGSEPGTQHDDEPWRMPDFEITRAADSPSSPHRHAGHEMVILVRSDDAPASRKILEATGWRFELGERWPWRIFRTAAYLYDDRLGIDLMWGIPGAPFPMPLLTSLERELWARATPGPHGFLKPEAEPLVVFLATQAARLHMRGAHRYASWTQDLAVCAEEVRSWERVWDVANSSGAEDSVRRGLGLAGIPIDPGQVSEREGLGTRTAWLGADVLIRHGWPRRIRGFAAAAPRLGTVTARVKFGGIVLDVGRDVFVPRGLAESLAVEAVRILRSGSPGVMVDVGTGCGPVALAVASEVPGVEIHATETSSRALFWAARNRRRLGASGVHLHRGSLLDPLPERLQGRVKVMTANVPYVPLEQWQDGWRGRESQVVGPSADGLGLYRTLARQARRFLTADGRMIIQLQSNQWEDFERELRSLRYRPGEVLLRWGSDMTAWVEAG